MNFQEFKTEILKRAKAKDACTDEYKKAYKSESFSELFTAIAANSNWCCRNTVIDVALLNQVGLKICHENNFWVNESSNKGFLIADSATVRASGSATVRAWGSATVEAWDSAYIDSRNSIEHKISDKVILRYYNTNIIKFGENIKLQEL